MVVVDAEELGGDEGFVATAREATCNGTFEASAMEGIEWAGDRSRELLRAPAVSKYGRCGEPAVAKWG